MGLLSFTLEYPKICREEVEIHIVQSRDHILNTVSSRSIHPLTPIHAVTTVFRSNFELRRSKPYCDNLLFVVLTDNNPSSASSSVITSM